MGNIKSLLNKVARLGFAKSGEGYNAEYPFGDTDKPLPNCLTKKELSDAVAEMERLTKEKGKIA